MEEAVRDFGLISWAKVKGEEGANNNNNSNSNINNTNNNTSNNNNSNSILNSPVRKGSFSGSNLPITTTKSIKTVASTAITTTATITTGKDSPNITSTKQKNLNKNNNNNNNEPVISEECKKEKRIREINFDLEKGNLLLLLLGMNPVGLLLFSSRINIGCFVKTIMGTGIIVRYYYY